MELHYQAHAVQHHGRCLFRAFVPLTPEGRVSEMHIAPSGVWNGHSKGPFEFNAKVFDQIIARFEEQMNPMPIDYNHSSLELVPEGAPAAGWIQELFRKGDELWAKVEWTRKATNHIKEGEFKFCSPVIDFEATDRKTDEDIGVEMFNCALTNDPFLDGQHPIKLTRASAKGTSMTENDKAKVRLALGDKLALGDVVVKKIVEAVVDALPKSASVESVIDAVAGAAQLEGAAAGAEGKGATDAVAPAPAAEAPAPMADEPGSGVAELQEDSGAGAEAITILTQASGLDEAGVLDALRANAEAIGELLATTAGVDGTASDEEVAASAVAASDAPSADAAQLTAEKEILLAKVEELQTAAASNEQTSANDAATAEQTQRETDVDALVAAGRVLEDQRATFIAMDKKTFTAMSRTQAQVVPVAMQGAKPKAKSGERSDSEVEAAIRDLSPAQQNLFALMNTGRTKYAKRGVALEYVLNQTEGSN